MKLWQLRGKLVFVSRKTRARFPDNKKPALRGFVYLVVSTWWSPWTGTEKLALINEDGEEYATTIKCVELITENLNEKWQKLKSKWDEKNSIPVVARCIDLTRTQHNEEELHGAYFKLLNGKGFTLTKSSAAKWPKDLVKGKVSTVWLPLWKAKKMGIVSS